MDEYQETLTGTKDLPEEQMKKLWLWTWYTSMMDANGFTQIVTRYLNKRHGMPFEKFYEYLLDWGLKRGIQRHTVGLKMARHMERN